MSPKLAWSLPLIALVCVAVFAGSSVIRAAYESAQYEVVRRDGDFEIRKYPDLVVVQTASDPQAEGRDGSFMRLFRYISGDNEAGQKIAMTTPVFMSPTPSAEGSGEATMQFVVPKDIAHSGAPDPNHEAVAVQTRPAGKFAVIRFSGRMDEKLTRAKAAELRQWIQANGWQAEDSIETAGYDAPMTPPAMRRNEVLIRLRTE